MLKKLVDIFFWLMLAALGACYLVDGAAPFLEKNVAVPIRGILSQLTALLPFPLFEVLLVAIPVSAIVLLAHGRISAVVSVAKLLVVAYVITLGIPSRMPSRISELPEPTAEEYRRAAELISERLDDIALPESSLTDAAASAAIVYASGELGISTVGTPRIKTSAAPQLLTDMGIFAYYAFPTAEVILNSAAPDFMLTFSAAHETMHLVGVSGEDEANLFAFAALTASEDDGLTFSAYVTAFVWVGAELYASDPDGYFAVYDGLSDEVKEQLELRRQLINDGEDSALSEISSSLNDIAITLRDERGAASYSNTSRLIVDYLIE